MKRKSEEQFQFYEDCSSKYKEEKDGYFKAWLFYWSGGKMGEEHSPPLSQMEGGKYQEQLDLLD